jgi:hypothetical protein
MNDIEEALRTTVMIGGSVTFQHFFENFVPPFP